MQMPKSFIDQLKTAYQNIDRAAVRPQRSRNANSHSIKLAAQALDTTGLSSAKDAAGSVPHAVSTAGIDASASVAPEQAGIEELRVKPLLVSSADESSFAGLGSTWTPVDQSNSPAPAAVFISDLEASAVTHAKPLMLDGDARDAQWMPKPQPTSSESEPSSGQHAGIEDVSIESPGSGVDQFNPDDWRMAETHRPGVVADLGASSILDSQVQSLVSAMAGFSPSVAAQTNAPANYAVAFEPVLVGNWQ